MKSPAVNEPYFHFVSHLSHLKSQSLKHELICVEVLISLQRRDKAANLQLDLEQFQGVSVSGGGVQDLPNVFQLYVSKALESELFQVWQRLYEVFDDFGDFISIARVFELELFDLGEVE